MSLSSAKKRSFDAYEFFVAVPSYDRPRKIRTKTLAFLERHGLPADQVFIFVADETERKRYASAIGKPWPQIIVGELHLWRAALPPATSASAVALKARDAKPHDRRSVQQDSIVAGKKRKVQQDAIVASRKKLKNNIHAKRESKMEDAEYVQSRQSSVPALDAKKHGEDEFIDVFRDWAIKDTNDTAMKASAGKQKNHVARQCAASRAVKPKTPAEGFRAPDPLFSSAGSTVTSWTVSLI
eukprot:TRINITY_DN10878_c0_g1_i3.p1 TRINITY_DN10878_c0_g1~~TRINITY_DN10878_c0_g1_i3.p1  ORF type:complete len:240 (-),score=36.42 TRINITY_DN10878_c0_g1_i3:200-919(-)